MGAASRRTTGDDAVVGDYLDANRFRKLLCRMASKSRREAHSDHMSFQERNDRQRLEAESQNTPADSEWLTGSELSAKRVSVQPLLMLGPKGWKSGQEDIFAEGRWGGLYPDYVLDEKMRPLKVYQADSLAVQGVKRRGDWLSGSVR